MVEDATIFIVDDDEAVRDSLRALLESYLFTVEDFETTQQFLDGLNGNRDQPKSSCLVLDLHLPRSGGLALLQDLAERRIVMPVIVVTGSLDAATKAQVLAAGAVAAIEKPFEDLALLDVIRAALSDGGVRRTT